jgi:hypothetical protein
MSNGPITLSILGGIHVEPKVNLERHHSDGNRKPLVDRRFAHARIRWIPLLFQGSNQRPERNHMFELRAGRSKEK